MLTQEQYREAQQRAAKYYDGAGIVLTQDERLNIEVSDMGLSDLYNVGIQMVTYINTARVCAKEMVLFPYQTCPQHMHIGDGNSLGKEETFRCRKGIVYLYVSGAGKAESIKAKLPPTKVDVFKEIVLRAGEQYTLEPQTWHWFQAGAEGAIISEFSTTSTDETDVFLDERLKRLTEVK